MLDIDTTDIYTNKYYQNLYRVGVHADGTCLIHSFLFLTDEKYRKLSIEEKKIVGHEYRDELGNILLSKKINKHIKLFIDSVSKIVISDGYSSLQEYVNNVVKKPDEFLDDVFISFLEALKRINIVVMKNNTFYMRGDVYSENRDTILISNIDSFHFEPLMFINKDSINPIYVLTQDIHKSQIQKIIKDYKNELELNKQSNNSTDQNKETNQEKHDFSMDDDYIIPENIKLVKNAVSSTDLDYYETIISEEDILFETISDMGEIILTRVNKNAPILFSKEQSFHVVNELFQNGEKKPLLQQRNQLYIDMLYSSKVNDLHSRTPKYLMPIIVASKEFLIDFLPEHAQTDDDIFSKYIYDHLNEMKSIQKQNTYENAINKLKKHKMIMRINSGDNYTHSNDVIRLCPSLFQQCMRTIYPQCLNTCDRYDYSKEDRLSDPKRVYYENKQKM